MNLIQQTKDPTLLRFPSLFSPSHTDHIRTLERMLGRAIEEGEGAFKAGVERGIEDCMGELVGGSKEWAVLHMRLKRERRKKV